MTQNRKVLGMTTTQIAILAGMAIGACLLFSVAGFLFLRGGSNMLAAAPQQVTPVAQETWTPYVTPTLAATETPTPIPYEMLIPQDWVQFKTELVEIWLPKNFKKAKPDPDDSGLTTELMMTGFPSEASVFPSIVMIAYQPVPAGGTLDDVMELQMASLSTNEMRVVEMRKVTLNSTEAIRLVIEMRMEGTEINGLVYVFQDGGTGWLVYYMAQINDFYTMLDTFEKSIKTFRMVR